MFILSSKAYEFGKKLVQIILPAFASLYFGLASIWGLPDADKVVGTTAVITTFLGVCLGISNSTYNKTEAAFGGSLVVTEKEDGKKLYSLELNDNPEAIELKDKVTFKVQKS